MGSKANKDKKKATRVKKGKKVKKARPTATATEDPANDAAYVEFGVRVSTARNGGKVVPGAGFRLAELRHPKVLHKKEYEHRLAELQLEMLEVQQAYRAQKLRGIVVVEGPDAAGKGGMLRRLTGRLDPRGVRVHAIGVPTPEEQGRHYLYRFFRRLPAPGRIALFDRSWYGRVLVERVEGFAPWERWQAAYEEINRFEDLLAADGIRLIKLFLYVTPAKQLERFSDRLHNPYKRWKFSEQDLRNRRHSAAYLEAFEEMFEKTSRDHAPWTIIGGNHKWFARLAAIDTVVKHLGQGVDLSAPQLEQTVVKRACKELGIDLPGDVR